MQGSWPCGCRYQNPDHSRIVLRCANDRPEDQAAKGEPFVIAKAGKPLVKVVALGAPAAGRVKRLGFMSGQLDVPDDFDQMGAMTPATTPLPSRIIVAVPASSPQKADVIRVIPLS
jgi:antitoxin (DNA-binding transcriptional repressor) of toxin-antitoxin stability system